MALYVTFPLIVLVSYILFNRINAFYQTWYHSRRAKELGCKPAYPRPYNLPLGVDQILRLARADKRQQVPNELLAIYEELGRHPTWAQRMLGATAVVTTDPKNIQAILATQFHDFEIGSTRRGNFFPMLGNGIFTSDGRDWEHSRALLRPQFARDQVADLDLEERHVQEMFEHLRFDGSSWTSEVNLSPLFFRLTIDSATEFLFGESVHAQSAALVGSGRGNVHVSSNIDCDPAEVARCFDRGTHMLGKRARLGDLYWLHSPKSFHNDIKTINQFADYYVNLVLSDDLDHAEKGEKSKSEKYVFLRELAKSTRDPIELRSQLLNILLAGRDTTAGLLGWVFWSLARHPQVFNKLRGTIIDTFGTYEKPRDISFATLKGCVYLQHVMNETLRLFPTVPGNSRRAVKDTTIPRGGGPDGQSPVYVRKGEEVNYIVHVMHHRKDLWGEDAEEFKPERWRGRKVGWEYLPFNGGPRICLGQQFALTEAGYVIVRMLQRFDQIENVDTRGNEPFHQYSVTTAPVAVPVRLHVASS